MVKDALLPSDAALKKAVRAILRKSGAAPAAHLLDRLDTHYSGSPLGTDRRIMRAVLMQAIAAPPAPVVIDKPKPKPAPEPVVEAVEPEPAPEPAPEPEPTKASKPKKEEKMMSLDLSNAAAMLQFSDDEDDASDTESLQLSDLERQEREAIKLGELEKSGTPAPEEETLQPAGPTLPTPNIDFAVENKTPSKQSAAPNPETADPTDAIIAQEVAEALEQSPEPEFAKADSAGTGFTPKEGFAALSDETPDEEQSEATVTDPEGTSDEPAPDVSDKVDAATKKDNAPKKGVPQTDLSALSGDTSLFDQLGGSFGDTDD